MICLVRHGQTEFNLERRHHGHLDSPLTELGREQAHRAGKAIGGLIDPRDCVIFSSPLGRAVDTAKIIAQVVAIERPIIFDPDLMEIGMGSAEGMTQVEFEKRWPLARAAASNTPMSAQSPDGETLEALAVRLQHALRRITGHGGGPHIVVSHGVASRVFRALYVGVDLAAAVHLEAPPDVLFCLDGDEITPIPY
jgi:broad specificity phosphatase PhoE